MTRPLRRVSEKRTGCSGRKPPRGDGLQAFSMGAPFNTGLTETTSLMPDRNAQASKTPWFRTLIVLNSHLG